MNTPTCLDTFVSSSGSSKVELRLSSVVSILFLIKSISSCYYFGHLALCCFRWFWCRRISALAAWLCTFCFTKWQRLFLVTLA